MTSERPLEPIDMEWLDKGVLSITWSDEHKGVYPVRHLAATLPLCSLVPMNGLENCA